MGEITGQVGENARQDGGAVGQSNRDEEQFARSVAQVRDAGSHQSNNQQGDEHPQEVAEYGVEGKKYAYSPSGEKERAKDTKGYGHQYFGQDAKLLQIHR